jgi:hypothetical protein
LKSHLAVRHLVRQLELAPPRGTSKPSPPDWLLQLADRLAERFEPFSGVARVGFVCSHGDAGWELALFLGENEIVGGPEDGHLLPVNFRFDLHRLQSEFDDIVGIYWNAFPSSHACFEEGTDLSFLAIEGMVNGHPLRIQVHAGPPDSVGPAIKQHADGRMEIVENPGVV